MTDAASNEATNRGLTHSDVVDAIRDAIVGALGPRRVILFGSHARGDAGPDSDYDILIVIGPGGDVDEARVAARRAMRHIHVSKDVVVVTQTAFDDWAERRSGVVGTALVEGRVLHEAP